jgi:hypothetical protein
MRPSGLTAVASLKISPAPPTARDPRCTRCHSLANPSTLEYSHIGETKMRLEKVNPRSVSGSNKPGISPLYDRNEDHMRTLLIMLVFAAAVVNAQETKKVPSDSVEVYSHGCFKGRVFTATSLPEDENTRKGPDITGRSFRVAAPKEVMDLVKRYDRQFVAVVGIVRRASLDDQGIGMRVGKGARVVIGAPGSDPTRPNATTAAPSVATMDVTAVRLLSDRCPIG